ncbi:MAG: hypothetical protein ACRC6V_18345 [Bacteroidales bacterium]
MTEFHEWLDATYQAIKTQCMVDGRVDVPSENRMFMEMFYIDDYDLVDTLISHIHCGHWTLVDEKIQEVYDLFGVCLESSFRGGNPEEILV